MTHPRPRDETKPAHDDSARPRVRSSVGRAQGEGAASVGVPRVAARRGVPRRRIALAVSLVALVLFVAAGANRQPSAAPYGSFAAPSKPLDMMPAQDANLDYSNFSHRSARHASLACDSCHTRARDNSPTPLFPGHKACIECHRTQFFTPQIQMCNICHANVDSASAPLKNFPAAFNESFNVRFDHAQHMSGAGRPAAGCVACHAPARRGVAQSIPATLAAHNQCYTCHTPGSRDARGRDLASCSVCHALKPYRRTPTDARAFRAGFSHAQHGARRRLGCADCHTVTPNLPQARQVSAPLTAQHFPAGRAMSCMTCHDGRRAFGDADFRDCRRCHQGQTFRMAANLK